MTFDELSHKLKDQDAKLRSFGVASLTVFGSVARNQATPDSDVDFCVEFSGIPTFDRYSRLKFFLEDLLNCHVDLATKLSIRPELRPSMEQDARRVA
jgi:predicted nucleotidyltransferase